MQQLPGWLWRVMSCSVSDDARVTPDFNDPVHGERLRAEFQPERFHVLDFERHVEVGHDA